MAAKRDCICERFGYAFCFLCTLTTEERAELRELNKWQDLAAKEIKR